MAVANRTGLGNRNRVEKVPAEPLTHSVRETLHSSPYRGLRSVELVVAEDDKVVLSGQVRTYFLKQMAQHLAAAVVGFERIRNELRVA